MPEIKLAPSILTADFSRLGEQLQEAETAGADWIHLDVMDGHYVPNLTFGPSVIEAIRPRCKLPFDVHLMIEAPENSIPDYAAAGADRITVHVETCPHLHRTVQLIRECGALPGVTLNPGTPVAALGSILTDVDLVLVMTVNPGFGGQKYIQSCTEKIEDVRRSLDRLGSSAELEVDGGVNENTLEQVVRAGASVVVMGSAIYNQKHSVAENIQKFRALTQQYSTW